MQVLTFSRHCGAIVWRASRWYRTNRSKLRNCQRIPWLAVVQKVSCSALG